MRSGGASAEVIDLSSDDDEEPVPVPSTSSVAVAIAIFPSSPRDIKPYELADVKPPLLYPPQPPGCRALVPVKNEDPVPVPLAFEASEPPRVLPPPRLCRQFWKSGEYVVTRRNPDADAPGGRNRLRINPKFLHSNATSHKWAFGAIAELLDNAIDEVNNGATFVRVNKFTNPRDGNPSLLIQDDGGGMDPEALRCCMSFGFSEKQSDAFIGQYGNGFKTSTMRLGADVIVFTQSNFCWAPTRSIGLLSYTFLMETGCDDVLVPTVDYQYDLATASYTQLLRHNQKLFSSNLAILSKWSPFASEAELLKQFDDMGEHGTKIIVYNLWFNDDGDMELDFNSDTKMAFQQVVRMTRCEDTPGFPAMLCEMLSYLGYVWYPDFRVFEIPRGENQNLYRAVVSVPTDDPRRPPLHSFEATASSVDLAMQRAAYLCATVLRKDYTCFKTSPFRYVPPGFVIPSQNRQVTCDYADQSRRTVACI